MRKNIARLKLAGMAITSILLIPIQFLVLAVAKGEAAYFIPQLWHKIICAIFGLKTEFIGSPEKNSQALFLGNHLSHFDIFIIGSHVRASFVAKEDLAKWPGIRILCYLQQTAFVSRSSGQATQASNNVRSKIDDGKNIVMFPEGTSTRGETVLDFKSSLFALPMEYASKGLKIQPFTILLLDVDGQPARTQALKDLYAWDRDNTIEIGPHIWNFAQTKGAKLKVIFHPVVTIAPGEDRKTLSKRIHEIVAGPLQIPVDQTSRAV